MNLFKTAKSAIHSQLSSDALIRMTLDRKEGSLNDTGALCISTGKFTGRSPKDKFVVDEIPISSLINWDGVYNNRISAENFESLLVDMQAYLGGKEALWHRTCLAGADAETSIKIQVYNEFPSGNLFALNMFLRPEELPEHRSSEEWYIIQAPTFHADPERHGTRAQNFSVISFSTRTILIGGSGYTGEMKKGIFTVLNYLLPIKHHALSMHCSANIGEMDDVALFFGLSGTGKTTLSTDPRRRLIGDDEHGWRKGAVFNFEGGCYAKIIGLSREKEPDIFRAIRKGALVENTTFIPGTNSIDYDNGDLTENTRVSYPIAYIDNIAVPSSGKSPRTLFFLTCDATGVLPPLSKLTAGQAKYYFLSGYTSKIPGTETEVREPQPTFSTCFGAPFLPLHPRVYAGLLNNHLKDGGIDVWLVNTGWSGQAYPQGSRISIHHSRSMINAVLSGYFKDQHFDIFPIFNLQVPFDCPEVPEQILNPYKQYSADGNYMDRLKLLSIKFNSNFERYRGEVDRETIAAGPLLKSSAAEVQ